MSYRNELIKILRNGKSVFHGGVHYTSIEELPSEAELAKGDKQQEDAAKVALKAEAARIAAELAALEEAPAEKAEVKTDAKDVKATGKGEKTADNAK